MAGLGVHALTIVAATVRGVVALGALPASAQDGKPDWREQNAYTLGVQAYLYAFPWAYMPEHGGCGPWRLTDRRTVSIIFGIWRTRLI